MKSMSEIISTRSVPAPKERNERSQIIKEIYELYTSISDKKLRRQENWKRYCEWCRDNRYPNNAVNQKIFRQSHRFIRVVPIGSFCYLLSHLSITDLYYTASVCRDRANRGESVGAWVIGQCKAKKQAI